MSLGIYWISVFRYTDAFISNGYDDMRALTAMSVEELEEIGIPAQFRFDT